MRANLDAHDLFCRNRRHVESIVDYACRVDAPDIGSVQRQLSTAVCGVAETVLPRAPDAGRLPARPMTVRDGKGMTIGNRNKQVDKLDIAVEVSRAIDETLSQVKEHQQLASTGQKQLKARPEEIGAMHGVGGVVSRGPEVVAESGTRE